MQGLVAPWEQQSAGRHWMCTHLPSASGISELLRSRVEDAERPILRILGLPFVFLQAKDSYQELLPTVVESK